METYWTPDGYEIDGHDAYDEMLNEIHDWPTVGGITFAPSDIIRELDPIAYRVGYSDYESDQIESGEWLEGQPDEDDDEG